jgi:hypothetical protein
MAFDLDQLALTHSLPSLSLLRREIDATTIDEKSKIVEKDKEGRGHFSGVATSVFE